MLSGKILIIALVISFPLFAGAQCITPPPVPDCTGTEPLATDGETINSTTTKWYYGGTVSYNSLSLNGGTLIVCGDLTVDKFYITTGTIFIRPGARLVIGSGVGAGLQFQGGCYLYNFGTCEIQRNLSLENSASAVNPNIVINALPSSVFKMSNQYLVINNNYSWFENNGSADFWGLITDAQSSPGSVCLGNGSTTKMAILINKVANTYKAPSGNACVNVLQYSEFYGQLTSDPTVFVCLAAGHSSNNSCIPFGCHPNDWGSSQVFTGCSGCATLSALPVRFLSFTGAGINNRGVQLTWETAMAETNGKMLVLRSGNGRDFKVLDSIFVHSTTGNVFHYLDTNPLRGTNFYRIVFSEFRLEMTTSSSVININFEPETTEAIYPVPFGQNFTIIFNREDSPKTIELMDMYGRTIPIIYTISQSTLSASVKLTRREENGLYLVCLISNKSVTMKTVLKR
ncbi:MAG TPA: T9SS type A sorting domain-containing protein [Chitinophagaceae bacterium]|nr:T9SS type A sorting domain-containing protein [Chitinophagaceae bacterium]